MHKLEFERYIVASKNKKDEDENNYKSMEIDSVTLYFISLSEFKTSGDKYRPILLNWQIIRPVLEKLINDDWEYKFENDGDEQQLEQIEEESIESIQKLDEIMHYFSKKYSWPYAIPDPILHSRLLITSPKGVYPIVIYYGETIGFRNNMDEDIKHLFTLIWNEYKKYILRADR